MSDENNEVAGRRNLKDVDYFAWIISVSPDGVFSYQNECLEIVGDKAVGKSILRNLPPNNGNQHELKSHAIIEPF